MARYETDTENALARLLDAISVQSHLGETAAGSVVGDAIARARTTLPRSAPNDLGVYGESNGCIYCDGYGFIEYGHGATHERPCGVCQ